MATGKHASRSEFGLEIQDLGGTATITISGHITERSIFDLSSLGPRRSIVVDPAEVKGINSFGVRTWVNFISELRKLSPLVSIRCLPVCLVAQACMITSFLGDSIVESFYTPWVCLECDRDVSLLQRQHESLPTSSPCPTCGGEMEFDDVADSYAVFLKHK